MILRVDGDDITIRLANHKVVSDEYTIEANLPLEMMFTTEKSVPTPFGLTYFVSSKPVRRVSMQHLRKAA